MTAVNPILVEITRGGRTESRHRGAAVVVDETGRIAAAWGDVAAAVYPRSAIKPLQALPLVETTAADRFRVGDDELALAAASHAGEPEHVRRVGRWLLRLGLAPDALVCGAHLPLSDSPCHALFRAGQVATPLHNNCSGKHTGMLTTVLHRNEPIGDYGDAGHPAQCRIARVLAAMADLDQAKLVPAVDGCGVPTWPLPLAALALAFARLARPDRLPAARAAAVRRVTRAIRMHPAMLSGAGRFDTCVVAATQGQVIAKGGAEGVHAAAILPLGLGIALKIDDGGRRAADAAMAALLLRFAPLGDDARRQLQALAHSPLVNTRGAVVGTTGVACGWPD